MQLIPDLASALGGSESHRAFVIPINAVGHRSSQAMVSDSESLGMPKSMCFHDMWSYT